MDSVLCHDASARRQQRCGTNPENGTVSYVHNNDGTVQSKTDAKGVRAEFTYDAYARVTQTRRVTAATSVEDRCQRVDYTCDENGGYSTGRLTRVKSNWTVNGQNQVAACAAPGGGVVGFEETYSYNAAGRVSTKTMSRNGFLDLTSVTPANVSGTNLGYDNDARKTQTVGKDGAIT